MRTAIISIMSAVFVMSISNVQAEMDWDFYEDGTIDPCDEYSNVRVFDTPPDHTTLDVMGGIVDSIGAYDESTVNVSGGTVSSLYAFDSSTVNASGGIVGGLSANGTGTVNVFDDGRVGSLLAQESGVVNMSGGTVDSLGGIEFGTVNLSGGFVLDSLGATGSGLINVFGYNLAKTATGGAYGYGFLTGEWTDETIFSIDFSAAGTYLRTNLYEIPEPCTLVLIMTGVLFFRRLRR